MAEYDYEGEVRLLRWGDTSNAGQTITLELDGSNDAHPFKQFPTGQTKGQRFRMAFSVIFDDEASRDPATPPDDRPAVAPASPLADAPLHTDQPGGPHTEEGLRYRNRAFGMAAKPSFRVWAAKRHGAVLADKDEAAIFIRQQIGGSMTLFDHSLEARQRLDNLNAEYDFDNANETAS